MRQDRRSFSLKKRRDARAPLIGAEHLLLGLLREDENLGARALASLDVTVEGVQALLRRLAEPADAPVSGEIPFTTAAQRILEDHAASESLNLGYDYIGPEHILLGLIREQESIAVRILRDLGAGPDDIRGELLQLLPTPASGSAATIAAVKPTEWLSRDQLWRAMHDCAVRSLDADALVPTGIPSGLRAVDLWSEGDYGSVLFWIDAHLPWGWGLAHLEHVDAKRNRRGKWKCTGGGGVGVDAEVLKDLPSGLHKLGGSAERLVR
jgi:Clp amino terminal domain, pathogenicity island component